MIRLEPQDFEEPALSVLAAQTQLSAASFKARFMASALVYTGVGLALETETVEIFPLWAIG